MIGEIMTEIFTAEEFIELCKKILRHEGYLYELANGELKLTDKGRIVVRMVEHV